MQLDCRIPPALAAHGVELMHLLSNPAGQAMTPFVLDPVGGAYGADAPIALLDSMAAGAGSPAETLRAYEHAAVGMR